jgi:hypothetical protein
MLLVKARRRERQLDLTTGAWYSDYHRICCKDFYADQDRDESIEGCLYWCNEHMQIHQDVYWSLKYPLRGTSAIDLDYLQNKPHFDDVL